MPANARLWGWSADPPPGWPKSRDEDEEARRGAGGEEGRGCPLWTRVANAAGSDVAFGRRTGDPDGGRETVIDAGVLERALGDGSVVMRPGKIAGGEVAIAMWNRKNCGGEATSASASASASVSRR